MTQRNRRAAVRIGDIGRMTNKVMDKNMTLEEQEKMLSELAQKIYNRGSKIITPMRGWILVRWIEERTELNGIFIPDKKQAQAMSEGIVLSVWEPWTEFKTDEEKRMWGFQHECSLKVGDRVLFNRWDGMPAPFFDEKKYRLIHEKEGPHANGGIVGNIHYHEDEALQPELERLFKNLQPVTESLFRGKSE